MQDKHKKEAKGWVAQMREASLGRANTRAAQKAHALISDWSGKHQANDPCYHEP